MIRTQISLPKADYLLAKKEAKRLGMSLAAFLRHSLSLVLPVKKDKPWMKYCGTVASGDPHSSQHIDDVIYGDKP